MIETRQRFTCPVCGEIVATLDGASLEGQACANTDGGHYVRSPVRFELLLTAAMTRIETQLVHLEADVPVLTQQVAAQAVALTQTEARLMQAIDDILAKVTAQTTVVNGLTAFITSLKANLDEAIANAKAAGLSEADAAELTQISAGLDANTAAIVSATTTGTAAAPEPPAPEVVVP